MIYQWYLKGRCGITLAARPGSSPHESGFGVDVEDYSNWKRFMEANRCSWQGANDVRENILK